MTTLQGRRLRAAASLMSIGLIAAGCGDAPEERQTKATDEYPASIPLADDYDPNGHYSWAYTAFAPNWDPTQSTNGADINFFIPAYDRLLLQTPDGEIEPMLATEFTAAEDNKSMTLTLREGLTFSDGEPFNAEAVKINLDRSRAQGSLLAGELSMITSVEVIDEYTVKINVNGWLGSLPVSLTVRGGIMISPKALESGLVETQPVGIGPYTVTETVPGDRVEFTRTEGYWEPDAQRVATMTYRLISDDQTRYNALVAGEIDGAQINPDQVNAAEQAGINVIAKPSVNFLFIVLSTAKQPFDDVEVRKAFHMSVDREAIAEGLYDGHCTPNAQAFPPGAMGYSEKVGTGLDVYPYDPEAAKAIFAEKGMTERSYVNLTANVTIYTTFAEIVQSELKGAGVESSVRPVPPAQVFQEFAIDQTGDMISAIYPGVNDPTALLDTYFGPTAQVNTGKTDYSTLLQYGAEGAASMDPDERQEGYDKLAQEWMDNPPHVIPICHVHLAAGFSDRVSNVHQPMSGGPENRGVAVSG